MARLKKDSSFVSDTHVLYIGPIMLDIPEEYEFKELVMKAIATEMGKLYYSDGRLFIMEYDTIHGVMDEKFAIVEMISDASFCDVGEYRSWALYHGSEDVADYADRIENIRGDTTVLPVIRTSSRFLRKINEYIVEGKFRSFIK